jgi:ABC-type transport system involved in multi-copper enzyme maturation permease subunit
MLHLLKIEWLKVKNYRTFWLLLVITIISVPAFNYVIYDVMDNSFPKIQGKSIIGTPFGFPDVWQTVTYNSTLLLLIPAVLIITLITNEFTYKTHRQNVIDGLSRSQFINVKLVEVFFLCVLLTIIVFISCLVFGHYGSDSSRVQMTSKDLRYVGFYFIEALSYSLIAFVLGMFIKRAGLAMGVFFIYMILEQFAVGLIRNKFKFTQAVSYLPEEVSDMLIPQPYLSKVISSPEKMRAWESQLPTYLALSIVYIILYCLVSNWRFRKNDI